MKISQFPIHTLKETPADAEVISHQLLIRAGMIRKLASGLYSWMPLGLRVLRKVEAIVREEMNKSGALELLMPMVQPAELWQESGRWEQYGPELLRIKDRHQRDFCLGPTHEEVITDIVRNEINSYKQLPLNFYQIQTKFRDEIRPRFGLMRGREFLMKDAYSFHINAKSLQETYAIMYQTYTNIFNRLGLGFRAVAADTGSIGGDASHEFHVLAQSGEDLIAYTEEGSYAANVELVPTPKIDTPRPLATQTMQKVSTPNQHTIEELCNFLKVKPEQTVKTLIVNGVEDSLVALIIRGDRNLNKVKAEKLESIAIPFQFASEQAIKDKLGCSIGSIGPVGLQDKKITVIADYEVLQLADFISGANEDDYHLTGVNWERDLPKAIEADLRDITAGEPSPDGKDTLKITRGIEVGHIFQLGTKYSQALNATVLDENGKAVILNMGCYGIGVSRIVAAAIEQNHDDKGIIWPETIAPFTVMLLPLNPGKSEQVQKTTENLYQQFLQAGIEVLLDDRGLRPGAMFADCELMGIPHRIVIGDKGLQNNEVEYQHRKADQKQMIALDNIVDFVIHSFSSKK